MWFRVEISPKSQSFEVHKYFNQAVTLQHVFYLPKLCSVNFGWHIIDHSPPGLYSQNVSLLRALWGIVYEFFSLLLCPNTWWTDCATKATATQNG
jgi:hypothetical protein